MSTQETTETTTPKKAKASKKSAKATKPAKTMKVAQATKAKTRSGSKAAIVLDLMKRKDGATLAEIAKDRLADIMALKLSRAAALSS